MPLKLLLGKAITGALAAKVKSSRFAMAAIKAAALRPQSTTLVKPRRFISVAVSNQKMAFCVTEAITLFEAVAPSFLLRLGANRHRLHHDCDRD